MKKMLLLLVVFMVLGGAVFAQGMWKDGTYTAMGDEFSHGWKESVRIVVENGYIVDVHFDALAEGGGMPKYLTSVQGKYGMFENGGAQSPWYVQADLAAAHLVKVQDPGQLTRSSSAVDAISGVSITINPYFVLAQEALSGARR